MTFGDVNLWLWAILFVITLLYEWATVRCTIAIVKLQSVAVANISVALNAIGMGCVYAYTGEINNSIPILAAVWLGNYYAVESEKKRKIREEKTIFDKNKKT
jgi:hypothetical protein